jgi:uncharacterized protein YndB with AHSA1/START domain/DNA-binding transcriptional ArsR family regulator
MKCLDQTFSALADPIRRAILARLARGDACVGELAEPFNISLPAISRHLRLLEEASLIERERDGKRRRCRLNRQGLAAAKDWLEFHQRFWTGSLDHRNLHLRRSLAVEKTTSDAAVDDTILTIIRLFDAPPARVFQAFLNRDEFQSWIGPEGIRCEVPLLEPRVGGRYRITMRRSDGRIIPVAGIFRTIEAPDRLGFTWQWDGNSSRESLITLTLRAIGNRTELTLRQEGLQTIANRDGNDKGWNSALNKLAIQLARQE